MFIFLLAIANEIHGNRLAFTNVLQKISVRFEVTNKTEFFYFIGPSCSAYLFKNLKTFVFQLNLVNGSNHDVYTASLEDSLYFQGYPYYINGNLMQLNSKKGVVTCEEFNTLTFFETVNELIISDVPLSKVLYKEQSTHIELLSLLATVPLCGIIFYLKRNAQ